jgi:FkbM family methyltransferase
MSRSSPAKDSHLPFGLRVLRKLPLPKKLGTLGRIYGNSLARCGVTWVETSAGPDWKLDLRNHTHRWIVCGDYEGPGLIEWARGWIRENSVVVDSGANIGQVLLYLAPKIRSGRYIAVEPHPVARQWLEECLSRYPQWKVTVEKFGLGECAGRASLAGQWGGDVEVGSHTELEFGSGEIEVVALDDYARQAGLQKIDFWKLDMEGAEESALRGADALLSAQAIRALVLETGRERFGGMLDMLAKHKYRPHGWNGRPLARGDVSSHRNVLFIADNANRTP